MSYQLHTVGQCPKCEAQVLTEIPDALRRVIQNSDANAEKASELADRLQVVILKLHKLQESADPDFKWGLHSALGAIIQAAANPVVVAP